MNASHPEQNELERSLTLEQERDEPLYVGERWKLFVNILLV